MDDNECEDMNRRQFLVGGTLLGTVGCLGIGEIPATPDGITVETQHRTGSHLVDDGIEPSGEKGRSYQTIIADRSAAQDRMKEAEEITEYVQETNFDQSYLVVIVGAAWQSGYWLELREIERTDRGLRMTIIVASPDEPVGDDAATHSLAVRVTDEQRDIPEEVEINGSVAGVAEVE